jgi:hypothetical protein
MDYHESVISPRPIPDLQSLKFNYMSSFRCCGRAAIRYFAGSIHTGRAERSSSSIARRAGARGRSRRAARVTIPYPREKSVVGAKVLREDQVCAKKRERGRPVEIVLSVRRVRGRTHAAQAPSQPGVWQSRICSARRMTGCSFGAAYRIFFRVWLRQVTMAVGNFRSDSPSTCSDRKEAAAWQCVARSRGV